MKKKFLHLFLFIMISSFILSSCVYTHQVKLDGDGEFPNDLSQIPFITQILDNLPNFGNLDDFTFPPSWNTLIPSFTSTAIPTGNPIFATAFRIENPDGGYSVFKPNDRGIIQSSSTFDKNNKLISSTVYNENGYKQSHTVYDKNGNVYIYEEYSSSGVIVLRDIYDNGEQTHRISYEMGSPKKIVEYTDSGSILTTNIISHENTVKYITEDIDGTMVMTRTCNAYTGNTEQLVIYKNNTINLTINNHYDGSRLLNQTYIKHDSANIYYYVDFSGDIENTICISNKEADDVKYYTIQNFYNSEIEKIINGRDVDYIPVIDQSGILTEVYILDPTFTMKYKITNGNKAFKLFCDRTYDKTQNCYSYILYNDLGMVSQKKVTTPGGDYNSISKIFYYEYDGFGNLVNTHITTVD